MKHLWTILLLCCFGSAALAQPLRNLAPKPDPATQPQQKPQQPRDLPILLLPFLSLNDDTAVWVGEAIQQNLLNELGRAGGVLAVTGKPEQAVVDVDGARKFAAAAGAPIVVFGSHQQSDGLLRVTGQILDVRTGKLLGAIKATGPLRDLFAIEDALAAQLRRVVSGLLAPPAPLTREPRPDPVERFARKIEGPKVEADGPIRQPAAGREVFPWDRDAARDRWNDRRRGPIVGDDYYPATQRYIYGSYGFYNPYPAVYGGPYFYPWFNSSPYFRSVLPNTFRSHGGLHIHGSYQGNNGQARFGF